MALPTAYVRPLRSPLRASSRPVQPKPSSGGVVPCEPGSVGGPGSPFEVASLLPGCSGGVFPCEPGSAGGPGSPFEVASLLPGCSGGVFPCEPGSAGGPGFPSACTSGLSPCCPACGGCGPCGDLGVVVGCCESAEGAAGGRPVGGDSGMGASPTSAMVALPMSCGTKPASFSLLGTGAAPSGDGWITVTRGSVACVGAEDALGLPRLGTAAALSGTVAATCSPAVAGGGERCPTRAVPGCATSTTVPAAVAMTVAAPPSKKDLKTPGRGKATSTRRPAPPRLAATARRDR